jgi:hypothetical protein
MFGACRLTPKFAGLAVASYQMTCANPLHNVVGQPTCTKSLSCSVAGGVSLAERALKYWAALGPSPVIRSKADHFALWSSDVLPALKEDRLPSTDELAELAKTVLYVVPPPPAPHPPLPPPEDPPESPEMAADSGEQHTQPSAKRSRHRAEAGVGVEDPLGGPHKGITEAQHERMLLLYREGAIGLSVPVQRMRSHMTGGTEYGVPARLREALSLGYLHPDLPPPIGFRWHKRGSKMYLTPQGG